MSIRSKTGQTESITEPWRALEWFTNRHHETRLFCERINQEKTPESILFLYGDGGNGKSLLLAYLRRYYCKHFESVEWLRLKNESHEHFVSQIKNAQGMETVPNGLIDFGMSRTNSDENPQLVFDALLMLRRQLSDTATDKFRPHLRFPIYTFATLLYMRKTNKALTRENLAQVFPAEEMDFVSNIADAFSGHPIGAVSKAVLALFFKRSEEKLTLFLRRRKLDPDRAEKLAQMDANELREKLPVFFAEDLNAIMEQQDGPKRVALFFDTHEAFWGAERDLPNLRIYERDEWLRALLSSLNLENGIVVVVAGREFPRWSQPGDYSIPENYIEKHQIGNLMDADALIYLERAGVHDAAMRQSLIDYARSGPDNIQPYFLGLSADIVLAAPQLSPTDFATAPQTDAKEAILIDRLLSYVNQDLKKAVYALSACRAFDESLFEWLEDKLKFRRADFEILTHFSFVWQVESKGQKWYRLHDLLRKLLRHRNDPSVQQADAALEEYYMSRVQTDDREAVIEAIYHINRQDWERGLRLWRESFETAIQRSQYDLGSGLLIIRNELEIATENWNGLICQLVGDYLTFLSRYKSAEQEYLRSITAYAAALRNAPDDVEVHNNKGNALSSLGDLQASLSQHKEALNSYQEAIAAYDAALKYAPDYVDAHNNKGLALQNLGDLLVGLAQHKEALQSYQEAIIAYDIALKSAPDYVTAHNNKGISLSGLGKLQIKLAQYQEALQSYQEAISTYDAALKIAPDHVYAHNNKGTALSSLGDLLVKLGQHQEALVNFQSALNEFSISLVIAPNDEYIRQKHDTLHTLVEQMTQPTP